MTTAQRAAAKVPQDHKAPGGGTSFEFDGQTYVVPPAEEWPIEVLEHAEDDHLTKALRALLGEDQYAKFRKTHTTLKDLNRLFEAAGLAAGTGNR